MRRESCFRHCNNFIFCRSHPVVYQPLLYAKKGNASAISVLVCVDKQLEQGQELEEGAFRFLVDQIRDDMLGELPGELLDYREWRIRFYLNCTVQHRVQWSAGVQ